MGRLATARACSRRRRVGWDMSVIGIRSRDHTATLLTAVFCLPTCACGPLIWQGRATDGIRLQKCGRELSLTICLRSGWATSIGHSTTTRSRREGCTIHRTRASGPCSARHSSPIWPTSSLHGGRHCHRAHHRPHRRRHALHRHRDFHRTLLPDRRHPNLRRLPHLHLHRRYRHHQHLHGAARRRLLGCSARA